MHLVDTELVVRMNSSIVTVSNDTLIVFVNESPIQTINENYDWQIYIPTKNRIVTISNIITNNHEGRKGCKDEIISFIQDGVLVSPKYINTDQFYTSGYRAYIKQ